jgi:Secretion system C-terminal sorting domain
MRRFFYILLLCTGIEAICQTPINPNPLIPFDKFTLNNIDIGPSLYFKSKRLNPERVVTYVAYAPFFTSFGVDYYAFDQFTNGNYGKLSVKDNDLRDIYTWNTTTIFNTLDFRVLDILNLSIDIDKINVLCIANSSNTQGFGNTFLGLLQFDTMLHLVSSKWFDDPYEGDFTYPIEIIKLRNGNYLKYGYRPPSELAVAEFDASGQAISDRSILNFTSNAVGGGGNIEILIGDKYALNPGLILDSNYQVLASFSEGTDYNRRYFGSIIPINSEKFIYGTTTMYANGSNRYASQTLAIVDLNGKEDTFYYKQQNITQFGSNYRVDAGQRAIEATDTNHIFFAFSSGMDLVSDVVVNCIKLDGTLNWSRSFGGNSFYYPIDFIRTPSRQYHLIVHRQYDTAWIDPQGFAFPKTDYMYVTFDTLGNVISISSDTEPTVKNRLLLYPNPANGQVKIEDFGQFKSLEIALYDLAGKLVKKESTDSKRFDVSNLPHGLYIYQAFDDDKMLIQIGKLVVRE